jgi:hypothetical protein
MTDRPMLAVFVPALMGTGILLSGGILVADGIKRLLPNRGLRRRVWLARAVHGVVEATARAAGCDIPEHQLFTRELRSRWTYLGTAVPLAALGVLALRAGIGAYNNAGGTLFGNQWAIRMGAAAATVLFAGTALLAALGVLYRRSPEPIMRLVRSTSLGRLIPPPEDPRERALALNPWLKEGETP